jgi:hypothetical protein
MGLSGNSKLARDEEPTTLPAITDAHLRMFEGLRPLSEAELAGALIRFANTGSVAARSLLSAGVRLADELLARFESQELPRNPERPFYQPGQRELQDALDKIASGKVTPRLEALWRRRSAGLVLLPDATATSAEPRYRYATRERWASEPQAAIAHALLLFLKKPLRGQLCRCQWRECRRFFLKVKPTGRRSAPIRKYCPDSNHGALAHQAGAKERMRKHRGKPL